MAYPEDPIRPEGADESGSFLTWALAGLALVLVYVLILIVLRPTP